MPTLTLMPSEPSTDPVTLAAQTLAQLKEAMEEGQNQCLPELMEIIHALSSKATEISVEQLAELVEKHIAVMAKVIASANTFGYNPTGIDITNVRDAIQVIGFERIRSLVTSLILVRHAADSDTTGDQRHTALLAVASGLIARSVAREKDLVDPELAFVSASLRQLGRLLVATYLPDGYKAACARAAVIEEEQAFEEQFGLTPLAITRAVLQEAHFPQRIIDTLHDFKPKSKQRHNPEAQLLISLSTFSERLCRLTVDPRKDEEAFSKDFKELCSSFDNRLSFEAEALQNILGTMGEHLGQFTRSLGYGNMSRDFIGTILWRSGRAPTPNIVLASLPQSTNESDLPPPSKSSAKSPEQKSPSPSEATKTPAVNDTTPSEAAPDSQHWRDGLVSISAMLGDNTIDMSAVYSVAMDFVRRGFGAPEAVVLRLSPNQRGYEAQHGVGAVFKRIRSETAVRKDERTVFGIALARRENVVIHNTRDPKIANYLPAWCSSVGGWGAFVAIPLCEQQNCFALMVIAWPAPLHIVITNDNARILKSLLSTVGAARRLSSQN